MRQKYLKEPINKGYAGSDTFVSSQLFTSSYDKFKSILHKFSSDMLSEFSSTFHSLDHAYKKKDLQQKQIIAEQKITIDEMRSFMDMFGKKSQQFTRAFKNNQQQQEGNIQKKDFLTMNKNKLFEKQKKLSHPVQSIYAFQQIKSQQKIKNQRQKQKQKSHHKLKQEVVHNSDSELLSISSQIQHIIQQQKPSKKVQPKPPLQCSSEHNLFQVSLTPNVTTLQYIQYKQDRLIQFDNYSVNQLQEHDLTDIQSIKIGGKVMNDETFGLLMKLNWNNLVSIGIDDNSITDISPLGNIDLRRLIQLDISWNPLVYESAHFLANNDFPSLIYFTLSFQKGKNQKCWEIMIKKQFKNYKSLQAIDIYNSNELSDTMKRTIQKLLEEKSHEQRIQSFNKELNKLPKEYKISLSWIQSQQEWEKYSEQHLSIENQKWIQKFSYKCKPIRRKTLISFKNQTKRKKNEEKRQKQLFKKAKIIKKSQK